MERCKEEREKSGNGEVEQRWRSVRRVEGGEKREEMNM